MSQSFKEIAELSVQELNKKLRDNRQELLNLTLKKKTGQLEKPHSLKELRRLIAQLETAVTQKRKASSVA